jgi:hypothetical protein
MRIATPRSAARVSLHDRPVRQDICGHVDFMLGAIDQRHVDMFEVFDRRVVNGRRGIGNARRERGEQETSRDAGAGRAAWHQNHRIPLVNEAIALGDTGDLRAVGSLG